MKIAGKVEPDPVTGQLKATFANNPQAPLRRPEVQFLRWSQGDTDHPLYLRHVHHQRCAHPVECPRRTNRPGADSFALTQSPGRWLPDDEAQMPNSPGFEAGTIQSLAGAYSPFVLKLTREDGSQRLGAITATLPEGMLGRFAGVPYCTDAQIAAATGRSGEGEGALEQSSPSLSGSVAGGCREHHCRLGLGTLSGAGQGLSRRARTRTPRSASRSSPPRSQDRST